MCTCGLSNRFCPSVSQSGEKFWNEHINWVKQSITWQSKKENEFVPNKDQSSSLLCISSSFLFNTGIVHHFDTVNHLDTVETRHVLTPSTCSRSPACPFPGLQKAGQRHGKEATDFTSLTKWVRDDHMSVKNPERSYTGLMRPVSYSMKLVTKYLLTAIRGCG